MLTQYFIDYMSLKVIKNNDYNSLWCTMYLCCLSILYIVVCINYSHTPFCPSPLPFSPLVNTSLLSIPVSLFLFSYIHSFFFRFHIWVISYSISFSLLFCWAWYFLGPPILLQISFFFLAEYYSIVCVCNTSSLSIHLQMDT